MQYIDITYENLEPVMYEQNFLALLVIALMIMIIGFLGINKRGMKLDLKTIFSAFLFSMGAVLILVLAKATLTEIPKEETERVLQLGCKSNDYDVKKEIRKYYDDNDGKITIVEKANIELVQDKCEKQNKKN